MLLFNNKNKRRHDGKKVRIFIMIAAIMALVMIEIQLYQQPLAKYQTELKPQSNGDDYLNMLPSNQLNTDMINDREKTYPYVPYSLVSKCGLAEHTYLMNNGSIPPLHHSLGFIKPHKTGGSTIAGLVNRIVDGRNLNKMIPSDSVYLGWPTKEFPGNVDLLNTVMNTTKYDAISNHAIFNPTSMKMYLRNPIFFFTILREPISRSISAFHYFDLSNIGITSSWKDYIAYFKRTKNVKFWHHGAMLNNLGFALGWYDFQNNTNRSTDNDQNRTAIEMFIQELDRELDFVLILEHLEESLLLLRDELHGIDIAELVWNDFKVGEKKKQKTYPTEEERNEISDLLLVDRMIYEHFRSKLLDKWNQRLEKYPSNTVQVREGLLCLHNQIDLYIDNQTIVPAQLKETFEKDSIAYTQYLKQKQHEKFGLPIN